MIYSLLMKRVIVLLAVLTAVGSQKEDARSFKINFEEGEFEKDGQQFRYISGSLHYFRVPQEYWLDRLTKFKAAGLNAVQFYVPWNVHEPSPGTYDFKDMANLTQFISLIHSLDMIAIARIGPYICAEWEFGGLPWWLGKTPDMKPRSSDQRFLSMVDKWFRVLLPLLQPHLYKNGGPIALIQVENEYGSRKPCDFVYKAFLRDLVREFVGYDTLLFTVDGPSVSMLKCGFIPDIYPTVDFGSGGSYEDIKKNFEHQKVFAPRGPSVNSEFYPGWLDHWGKKWNEIHADRILESMERMLSLNASFDFYMFHGGTNFGFMTTFVTSYDYDAPLSEAGDPTDKYFAIREKIGNLTGRSPGPVPPATKKKAYGKVKMRRMGSVVEMLDIVSGKEKRVESEKPMSFEDLNFPYGFVLYETKLNLSGESIDIPGINDRGYVHVNSKMVGIVAKPKSPGLVNTTKLSLQLNQGDLLQILVENTGRHLDGTFIDRKGILSDVLVDGNVTENWKMYPIELERILRDTLEENSTNQTPADLTQKFSPSIYTGSFDTEDVQDTFFDPQGWGKGQLYVNQNNVGRYWSSLGPQVTLFTPKTFLQNSNQVMMLELEEPGWCNNEAWESCTIRFVDKPFLKKTPPMK